MSMNLAAEYALIHTPIDPKAGAHRRTLAKAIGAACTIGKCTEPVAARRMCEKHYRRSQRKVAKHRGAVVADLEWILGTDQPDRVAERLGYSDADSLRGVLYRWGRSDLAVRLGMAGAA
jgi:hypothetical protein